MERKCANCLGYEMCKTLDEKGRIPFKDPNNCILYKDAPETQTVTLPCKVGQSIWFIRNNGIIETSVEKFVIKSNGLFIKLACNTAYETSAKSIGKTIFFSEEVAKEYLSK